MSPSFMCEEENLSLKFSVTSVYSFGGSLQKKKRGFKRNFLLNGKIK